MALTTACTTDDPFSEYTNYGGGSTWNGGNENNGNGNEGSSSSGSYTVSLTDIAIDKTTAEPTSAASAYYPEDEDNIENESFSSATTVNIVFNESGVSCDAPNTMTVSTNGAHLTIDHGSSSKVIYNVSGETSAGSLTIAGEKKYKLCLNGVSITNPDSTAINLLSKKRAYIALSGNNTLTDGSASKDSDQKAAFYCKGKMLFSGSGSLNVYGNTKNAIACADYIIFSKGNNIYAKSTANHGIKANDGIYINGGILNVEVSAAAAKGISCESDIIVNGGRTTCITTGAGAWDSDDNETKGSAGMKADANITVNGGQLYMKSTGNGGKGISADGTLNVTGGDIFVITKGSKYSSNNDSTSPKGIKTDGAITISGGNILVSANNEAIESKSTIDITGGHVYAYGSDDAINSKSHMTISGGYVMAHSTGNDGLDANGNCYIKGGVVYAIGTTTPEVGIDANTEGGYKLYVQGGTIVAIGGLEGGAQLSQSCYSTSSWSKNTWYALYNGDELALAFKTPSSGGTTLVVSTPGTTTLQSGVTVADGTSYFNGMGNIGGTSSDGSSVSISSYTATGGPGGGGFPGGGPGGRW
jgi:hypothetical protein